MYIVEYEQRDEFIIKRTSLDGILQITVSCLEFSISSTMGKEDDNQEVWIDAVITRHQKRLLSKELGIK